MKKIFLSLFLLPMISNAQFVTQGVCTQASNLFTLNGVSQSPYAGRVFSTTALNLNSNFDLRYNAYMGNQFNNGMAFVLIPGSQPTASSPPTVINTDNIHNFGTGSIATDFVIEFDIRGSFCYSGQNSSYEPLTDINHVSYWKNNSVCNFGNYYSPYSALGIINQYVFEPYRIKWTKATNTLETYYNNYLIKSNIIDLVGLLGSTVYWGFSAGCYCVTGGPKLKDISLNGVWLLPFNITSFTAEKNNHAVKLNWQTDYEQNTSHFIVEKSNDGSNFYSLQRVEAAGKSGASKKYSTLDAKPLYGTNFYRLKMTDIDGRFTYSNIVAARIDNDNKEISLFPNPVQRDLQVQIPAEKKENCTIQVQDMIGKVVKEQVVEPNNALFSTSINTDELAKGIYLLMVRHGDKVQTRRFIKQ